MNKTAIKNYAIRARVQLIEAVKQRAYEYEITEDGENKSGIKTVGDRLLTPDEIKQREQLIDEIRHKGYNQVMEEAAYTWFNRFIALRFMEVNGFLPSRVRVFTDESGAFKPEILKEAMTVDIDGLDRNKVFDLLDRQENEELFKYLIITQCNALNQGLPYMFEKISNWTELLFPANLLRSDSVIGRMVSEIEEEDWQDAVQIIGWMYQYYNTELKDDTFARLKKNIKISKERIPAATQLFTPDWIVRYMVENSLGRLWYEGHPYFDKSEWRYYLDEAEQEPAVEAEFQKIRSEYANIKPEDIKIIDPCMGSGHILVYAFDVLMQIYIAVGYSERDAAKSILENNIYGFDIDDRAGQLAYFAVMMKARKYSRRILNSGITPNVFSIQDSSFMSDDFIAFVAKKDHELELDLIGIRNAFVDAKEYGSVLSVPKFDYEKLYARIEELKTYFPQTLFESEYRLTAIEKLYQMVKQAYMLATKYEVVVTNPPYMGGNYSPKLASYLKENYPDTKADFFSVFMEKCLHFSDNFIAMVTPESWMFLYTFIALRNRYLSNMRCVNCAHLGLKAFECGFGTTAFVFSKNTVKNCSSKYIRLVDHASTEEKEENFNNSHNHYLCTTERFKLLPNDIMAYWCSDTFAQRLSDGRPFGEKYELNPGIKTGNNDLFLRLWFEVGSIKTSKSPTKADLNDGSHKWYFYNKGGGYRKWYGGYEYVVDFESNALNIRTLIGKDTYRLRNADNYFVHGILWPLIGSDHFSCRYLPSNVLSDIASNTIHFHNVYKYEAMAFMNSCVFNTVLNMINPTVSYPIDSIYKVPYIPAADDEIESIVKENLDIARCDWDSFETSWDFKKHPLVPLAPITDKIELAYEYWEKKSLERFIKLKANEEELNRIFIDIYGLQDELTPEVEDKDVTVRKSDLQREIKSLISYAIGCIFGRYSLDVEGLAFDGGEWDESKYKTVIPDADNILPICDDDYFEDDLANKIFKWVETVYGKETLEENLRFIADALGGKGTAREVIRNYLLNGFYTDHLKIYQKRPIYWLFSSGKKNGFKALIYMHRYQPDLLARMRTDYVHEQQERYRTQLSMLEESIASASPSEKVKLNKRIAKLKDQALEISQYEEKIHHLADQMISIDLDDGVKVNYAKFQDVLEKIK